MSGCTGPGDDESAPPSPTPTSGTADPLSNLTRFGIQVDQPEGPSLDGNWSSFESSGSGPPGTWLLVYQPLKEPREGFKLDVRLEFFASPGTGPLAVFVMPPTFVVEAEDRNGFRIMRGEAQVRTPQGGENVDDTFDGTTTSVTRFPYVGILFAIASTGHWNYTLGVVDGDAPKTSAVAPTYTLGGANVTMQFSRSRLPVGAPADRMELKSRLLSPGWAHFQVVPGTVGNSDVPNTNWDSGVRSYDVQFPSGLKRQGTQAPQVGAPSNGFGSLTEVPGDFSALITFAETEIDRTLALVHLPLNPVQLPIPFHPWGYCDSFCGAPP